MSKSPFYDDPRFISLYKQYETSLKAFRMAVDEAIRIAQREALPGPRRQVDPGPRVNRPSNYLDWDPNWNPLNKIKRLRRGLEHDAYKVFTYRGDSSPPVPPATAQRQIAGIFKDAAGSQLFGKDDRSVREMSEIKAAVEKHCRQVWNAYTREPEPKTDRANLTIVRAYVLAQESGFEIEATKLMDAVIARLGPKQRVSR